MNGIAVLRDASHCIAAAFFLAAALMAWTAWRVS
jgi:hypothetical protein